MALWWQDCSFSFLPFSITMIKHGLLGIPFQSIESMEDFPAMTPLFPQGFHGSTARKVLGVDAGETFEEVGRMVIKPSAARQDIYTLKQVHFLRPNM